MLKAIPQTNFITKISTIKAETSFGQNIEQKKDEFISIKPQKKEKSFLEKHWGKILLIGGIIITAILLKGKFKKIKGNTNTPKAPQSKRNIENELPKQSESENILKNTDKQTSETKIKEPQTESNLFNEKGLELKRKGLYEEALDNYNKAIELEPNKNPKLYNNRAHLYWQMVYPEKAFQDIDKALQLNPSDIDFQKTKQEMLKTSSGKIHSHFEPLLRANPKNPNLLEERALAYTKNGCYKQALEDINQAITLNPPSKKLQQLKENLLKYIKTPYSQRL